MDWFDKVKGFAEGAWETVSTGAEKALGAWADKGFKKDKPQTNAQPTNQANAAPAAANVTKRNPQVNQAGFMGFSNQQLMVAGGFALALVLIAKGG